MSTAEFWFDDDHFAIGEFDWDEFDARWPDDVEKPNPAVAERIVREMAEGDER